MGGALRASVTTSWVSGLDELLDAGLKMEAGAMQ